MLISNGITTLAKQVGEVVTDEHGDVLTQKHNDYFIFYMRYKKNKKLAGGFLTKKEY
ncbi:hypothetical protein SEEH1565_04022 [Salmonella enterica subsp. enterica serovar Heidelberg str. 41565]|nr:hypothetical protein SEEH1565_04022 [Salmonella enterica subsp. enterica serovar Heidelberg str. 41565]